jgi:hypothetical protein
VVIPSGGITLATPALTLTTLATNIKTALEAMPQIETFANGGGVDVNVEPGIAADGYDRVAFRVTFTGADCLQWRRFHGGSAA